MVGAEAVIAGAFGAVAEIKIGIGQIRPSADAALLVEALRTLLRFLLLLGGIYCVAEVRGLLGLIGLFAE